MARSIEWRLPLIERLPGPKWPGSRAEPGAAAENPVVTDPLAYRQMAYEADVHYGLMKALALKAGLSERVAEGIARGAEAPDVPSDPREPVGNGKMIAKPDWMLDADGEARKRESAERLREWHFPRNPGDATVAPNSEAARAKFEEAVKTGNPFRIGEALHPLQDSWSHQGLPSLGGVAGHPDARGGMLSHDADQTHKYPADADAMARETYRLLIRVGEENPAFRSGEPARFREFKSDVEAFIKADSEEEKRSTLGRLGVTMPEAYWEDVTLEEKDEKPKD